jgi:hypothetical protein
MFPIAGTLDFDELAERLCSIKIPDNGITLSLQIRAVDSIDLLNEFIVHLALFRVFISRTKILAYQLSVHYQLYMVDIVIYLLKLN